MRIGNIEMILINSSGQQFEEATADNIVYALVNPGDEYHVQVNIYRDMDGRLPSTYLRIGLYVDGHDVNYWKRIDGSAVSADSEVIGAKFWGFKKSGNEIKGFQVAPVSVSGSGRMFSSESEVGQIKAVIYEAEVTEGVFDNVGKFCEPPSSTVFSETQKFYSIPSVTTVAGRSYDQREVFKPILRWRNKSDVPISTVILRYHTRQIVSLLNDITAEDVGVSDTNSRKRPRDEISTDAVDAVSSNENGDVEIVPIVKHIPILDLTASDADNVDASSPAPRWTVTTVTRYG